MRPVQPAWPEPLGVVRGLIEAGRLEEASRGLEDVRGGAEPALVDLVALELRVAAGEIEAGSALGRVIAFLERAPGHAAAMSLYQALSLRQYREGRSCPSFSHPPPARPR